MTRTEILAMVPGREMEAVVARTIGWKNVHEARTVSEEGLFTQFIGSAPSDGEGVVRDLPNYSIDHGAAVEAADTFCRSKGLDYYTEYDARSQKYDVYMWNSEIQAGANSGASIGLPGLAFAICRAILLVAQETAK
jgi:hypothetical protein